MKRKEQYADEIIEILERTKCGAWASNINLNTKDRVIEVCQNCVDSWSGRKFKDHCTTPPQSLEQTRWIPVSDRLPEEDNCTGSGVQFSDDVLMSVLNIVDEEDFIDFGHTIDGEWYSIVKKKRIQNGFDVIAWMPLPQPYKEESERE